MTMNMSAARTLSASLAVALILAVPSFVVATPLTGKAKAVASFGKVKNPKNSIPADDFHVVIQGDVAREDIEVDGGQFGKEFGIDRDLQNHTTTIKFSKEGVSIDRDKSNKFSISLKRDVNALKITKAYWTHDGEPIPGAEVKEMPGFEVVNDPVYTLINPFDEPMGIHHLQFLMNGPDVPLEDLTPDFLDGFGAFVPDFVLGANSSIAFNIAGELLPGMFLYARAELFDAAFSEETGDFIHGHQAPVVPEPGTLALVGGGLAYLMVSRQKTRGSA